MVHPTDEAGRRGHVLIADADVERRGLLEGALGVHGFVVGGHGTAAAVVDAATSGDWDAVVVGGRVHGDDSATICRTIVARRPSVPVIAVLGLAAVHRAFDAVRAGAYDFVTRPLQVDLLADLLDEAIAHGRAQRSVERLHAEIARSTPLSDLIGTSPAMRRLYWLIDRVARADVSVLIAGETGTGKELVARALHERSHRASGPFVPVDCAAMPETLLEAELFGHVRGAFTDAREARPGLFRLADGGTMFLDEIGEIPPKLQPKLLRALQERRVRPVGGADEVPVDVRVIAATNRDLELEVAEGRFREDLFYRLEVVRIDVPPLRTRGHDVLLLARAFAQAFADDLGRPAPVLTPEAATRLLRYRWPGNVRELRNCMERAVLLAEGRIEVPDLAERVRHATAEEAEQVELLSMDEVERRHIERVLDAVDGNKSEAARILGLDRKTLYRKLDRLDESAPVADRHSD